MGGERGGEGGGSGLIALEMLHARLRQNEAEVKALQLEKESAGATNTALADELAAVTAQTEHASSRSVVELQQNLDTLQARHAVALEVQLYLQRTPYAA